MNNAPQAGSGAPVRANNTGSSRREPSLNKSLGEAALKRRAWHWLQARWHSYRWFQVYGDTRAMAWHWQESNWHRLEAEYSTRRFQR